MQLKICKTLSVVYLFKLRELIILRFLKHCFIFKFLISIYYLTFKVFLAKIRH